MTRNIIEIDEALCNGCGLCIDACHEGALALVDGKARLISDSYCDGLGHCLPQCPTGAIQIVEREAQDYDEELVRARQQAGGCPSVQPHTLPAQDAPVFSGCPSAMARSIAHTPPAAARRPGPGPVASTSSELRSWPVQIQLVPVNAPYFDGAHLLIAADCTAFAYANLHSEFMRGKITLIGCPKLDMVEYADKLREIIRQNNIQSVTVLRMEVPCCAGLVNAAEQALRQSGKTLPWQYHIFSVDGQLVQ